MPIIYDENDVFGKKLSDLADLCFEGEITNEWEFEFISAMIDRFEKGWNFSDNMVEKVNEIHGRYY